MQANVGDLQRNLSFGFTEPYLRNKPISLGVQVFTSKYDYNPAKSYSHREQPEPESDQRRSSRC